MMKYSRKALITTFESGLLGELSKSTTVFVLTEGTNFLFGDFIDNLEMNFVLKEGWWPFFSLALSIQKFFPQDNQLKQAFGRPKKRYYSLGQFRIRPWRSSVIIDMTPLSQTKPISIQKNTPTLYILNKSSISSGQIVWKFMEYETKIISEL